MQVKGNKMGVNKKLLAVIYVSIAILTVVVTLLIMSLIKKDDIDIAEKIKMDTKNRTDTNLIRLSDFYLEESSDNLYDAQFLLLREKIAKWSKQQSEKFWIPPQQILLDYFRKENEGIIKELFEKYQ